MIKLIVFFLFFLILTYLIINKRETFNVSQSDNIKNKIIYVLWLGNNKFSKNRQEALDSLRKKSNCNVEFIKKEDIKKYILDDYPLHPAFKYLSTIHQADYFRCYLMHHYGGGYSDLKKCQGDWSSLFNKLYNNKNIWAIGLKGRPHFGIAYPEEYTRKERQILKNNHDNLIGVGYFIYKKNTPLTTEWYEKLHERLDLYYEKLKENPASYPRESSNGKICPSWEAKSKSVSNNSTKYPLSWNRILGQINYPLQLKYINHIEGGIPAPNNHNYLLGD